MSEYLHVENSVDFIAESFNNDLSKVLSNRLLDHMVQCIQVVNEPTLMGGSLINHAYIKVLC